MRPVRPLAIAALAAACTPFFPPLAVQPVALPPASGSPQILVAARGGGPGFDAMLPLPLTSCTETHGPIEITVSLGDPDGLASARIRYGGAVRRGSLRTTPEGPDIVVRRRGGPNEEILELDFAAGPVRRTSAVANLTTAAPHAGTVTVTATDRGGAVSRAGPFRLVPSGTAGGCRQAG